MSDDKPIYGKRGRPRKTDLVDEQEVEALQALNAAFRDYGGNVNVRIERIEPHCNRGYCGEMIVANGRDISPEEIRSRFGGRVFILTGRQADGKFVKTATIFIDDVPRRNGKPILPDGATEDDNQKNAPPPDANELMSQIMRSNLPPAEKQALVERAMGKEPKSQSSMELFQQQAMMQAFQQMMQASIEMANSQRQSQMQMMQQTMQMMQQMSDQRDQFYKNNKPQDPLRDVKSVMTLFGDIKSLERELGSGGADPNPITQITGELIPFAEKMASQWFQYRAMTAQNKSMEIQQASSKPLTPRTGAPADVAQLGTDMGAQFAGLSPSDKQIAMQSFLASQNMVLPANNGIMDTDDDYIDDEDRELINANDAKNEQDAGHEISKRQHAESAQTDNTADRPGYPPGLSIPAH